MKTPHSCISSCGARASEEVRPPNQRNDLVATTPQIQSGAEFPQGSHPNPTGFHENSLEKEQDILKELEQELNTILIH